MPYAADVENQKESVPPTGCQETPTAPHSGISENQRESRTVTNGLKNWTVPHSTDTEKRDLHLLIGCLENQISPHTVNQETHPLSGCQPKQINPNLTGSGTGREAGGEEDQTVHPSVDSRTLQGSSSTVAALLDQTTFFCYLADTCSQRQTHETVDD